MKSGAMCFLLLLVAGSMFVSPASAGWRHMLQRSATAETGATAISTGNGTATATSFAESTEGVAIAEAFASSEVASMAQSILVNVYNQIVDTADLGNCSDIIQIAESQVTAEAMAIAEVYTTTIGSVTVEGEGQACAEAQAAGETAASAFAQATAAAFAEASDGTSEAAAETIVTAISAGTARAFADAFSSACTEGGFALAEQESFATAIVRPLVEVYALALGGASCGETAMAESIGEGTSSLNDDVMAGTTTNTEVGGDSTADAGGTAGAETEKAETIEEINAIKIQSTDNICAFPFTTCCTRRFSSEDTCTCSLSASSARCDATKIAAPDVDQIAWEDADGSICKCRRR